MIYLVVKNIRMSFIYHRLQHPIHKNLQIFICELDIDIDDTKIQKSIAHLQDYIIEKQYVEHTQIAWYISYIKHTTKTTKPVFTAETDELLQLYHNKINNTTIMEALQHTKTLELFIQNADSLNSFMVVTRCGKSDKSETALCKFYPYYNLF